MVLPRRIFVRARIGAVEERISVVAKVFSRTPIDTKILQNQRARSKAKVWFAPSTDQRDQLFCWEDNIMASTNSTRVNFIDKKKRSWTVNYAT